MLDALMLKGCTVTIDAMGCQRRLCGQDRRAGVRLRPDTPGSAAATEGFLDAAEQAGYRGAAHTQARWIEKDHGRIETRRCVATDDLGCLGEGRSWAGAKALVREESTREIGGAASAERRYCVSSRLADAEHMGAVVRGHWGVGTACTGRWTPPSAKTRRGCAWATRRRTSRSCAASP
ncbi:MAG: ISAs1 family transposase [Candidatus Methylumidiphilus sp.]